MRRSLAILLCVLASRSSGPVAAEPAIQEKVEKLDRFYDRITSCRVVLELAGRHKRHGRQFTARIDLAVPGGEIVVNKEHDEDLHIALRDAFNAARRQLEDYARTQRGD